MSTAFGQSTVLGYPRIGGNRQLKKAVEAYWAGRIDAEELAATSAALRAEVWRTLRDARLDAIPSNTFSYYDHVLDTAVAVGAIPHRFARLGLGDLDTYFAMARGVDAEPALELTKWFDTNYHYLVPEIGSDTAFAANPDKALREYREARELGIDSRPVLVGPATFLLLAKPTEARRRTVRPADRPGRRVRRASCDPSPRRACDGCSWTNPPTSPTGAPPRSTRCGRRTPGSARWNSGRRSSSPPISASSVTRCPPCSTRRSKRSAWIWWPGPATCGGWPVRDRCAARRSWPASSTAATSGVPTCGPPWRPVPPSPPSPTTSPCPPRARCCTCRRTCPPRPLSTRRCVSGSPSPGRRSMRSSGSAARCATAPRPCPSRCRPPLPPGATTPYAAGSPRCAPRIGSAARTRSVRRHSRPG